MIVEMAIHVPVMENKYGVQISAKRHGLKQYSRQTKRRD
jgi:hypothetical protein